MFLKIGISLNKALPILRKNRKSIEILIPNVGNSLKYLFPFSEFGKIGNLKGSPVLELSFLSLYLEPFIITLALDVFYIICISNTLKFILVLLNIFILSDIIWKTRTPPSGSQKWRKCLAKYNNMRRNC